METVTLPKVKFERIVQDNKKLKLEVESLRNTALYRRLLECLENLKIKEYTRKDLRL
ncbi:hypothetical protein HYU22_04755 [Candidatus Woesearchaeota archaeon]|nr:hypothetical protein [Candidatus Woesearchaeota archaeon]